MGKENNIINRIEILGQINTDISYGKTKTGNNIARFRIEYVDPVIKTKDRNIFPCMAFNEMAEDIYKYFQKGDKIKVVGKLFADKYQYPTSKDWSYGVQIWIDEYSPIEVQQTQEYNVDNYTASKEISIGKDDDYYSNDYYSDNGESYPF